MSKSFIVKLIIGILTFYVLLRLFTAGEFNNELLDINWWEAWPVLVFTLVINYLAALRWFLLLNQPILLNPLRLWYLKVIILTQLVGSTTNYLLGDLGLRSLYLKEKGFNFKQAAASVALDKGYGVLFVISSLIAFMGGMSLTAGAMPSLAFLIVSIFIYYFILMIIPPFYKVLKHKWPDKIKFKFLVGINAKRRTAIASITIIKFLTSVLRSAFIFVLCDIHIGFVDTFWGSVFGDIGTAISFTPGALGFLEAGWGGFLAFIHLQPQSIAMFLLNQRILTFASVLLLVPIVLGIEKLQKLIMGYTQQKAHANEGGT